MAPPELGNIREWRKEPDTSLGEILIIAIFGTCVLMLVGMAVGVGTGAFAVNGTAVNGTSLNATDTPDISDRGGHNATGGNVTNAAPNPYNQYLIRLNLTENGPTELELLYYLYWVERQKVANLTAQLEAANRTDAAATADLIAAQERARIAIASAEGREAEAQALIAGVRDLIADRDKSRADLLVMHQHALQCVDRHAALHHALAPFILNATGPPVPHPDGR